MELDEREMVGCKLS